MEILVRKRSLIKSSLQALIETSIWLSYLWFVINIPFILCPWNLKIFWFKFHSSSINPLFIVPACLLQLFFNTWKSCQTFNFCIFFYKSFNSMLASELAYFIVREKSLLGFQPLLKLVFSFNIDFLDLLIFCIILHYFMTCGHLVFKLYISIVICVFFEPFCNCHSHNISINF